LPSIGFTPATRPVSSSVTRSLTMPRTPERARKGG
jgi:hypothetical protein